MSVRVGVVGGLSIDHLVSDPVGARFSRPGGPGLYAALGARLVAGVDVRLYAGLPRSTNVFAEVLPAAGVDCAHCPKIADVPRVWVLNSAQGRRLVPATPPPGLEFGTDGETLDADAPAPPSSAFFDGLAGVLYSSPTTVPTPAITALVGVDPDQRQVLGRGDEYWRAIAVQGGVLLPSRLQLAMLSADPRAAAAKLATAHQISVVARLDVDGMYVIDPTGDAWTVHDSHVDVLDPTGAGDTSAGAIIAALAAGADLAEAAAFGVSAARIVLSDWGHEALAGARPMNHPSSGIRIRREQSAF
jgi:sugar/nucleoside kinase (ribokinase family)